MLTMSPKRTYPDSPWPERLKKLRARKNLSQSEAAQRLDVSTRAWISWENFHRRPGRMTIREINRVFGTKFPERD